MFDRIAQEKELHTDVDYKVEVTFLELYNEEIRDILDSTGKKPLSIREDNNEVFVTGLDERLVTNKSEMEYALGKERRWTDDVVDGSVNRTVGATMMNSESSRSHAIFTILLHKNQEGGKNFLKQLKKFTLFQQFFLFSSLLT